MKNGTDLASGPQPDVQVHLHPHPTFEQNSPQTPAGFQAGIAAEEPVKLVLSPSSDSRQPQWELLARAKDFGVLEARWEVVTGYEEVGPHCCLRVAQVDERPGADFAVEQRRHAEPYSSSSEA